MLVNKIIFMFAILVLSILIIPFVQFFKGNMFKFETSVWCSQNSNQSKLCRFKNICYDSQYMSFLFFLSNNSIIKGVKNYVELQRIHISSVTDHNFLYANITVIKSKSYKTLSELKIKSKGLLLSRFKPNNLMHCIHDDLLPLFFRLEFLCLGVSNCLKSYSLIFHDSYPKGPFFELYKIFSNESPILLNENSNNVICFEELVTGLVTDSVIYQYGFKKPHGPILNTEISQEDVSRFTSFFKESFKIQSDLNKSQLVLVTRSKSRKIINIAEVKDMIQNVYKKHNIKVNLSVINLDLNSNDLISLIELVSNSNALIGMHGAEMILGLFLKQFSFVLELFPLGIQPDVVSFIKSFSKIKGSNFLYYSWRNILKNNSLAHPDAPPAFGGIHHLSSDAQKIIQNSVYVPAVKCCNNPLFLYHMYQDTWVSDDFEIALSEALVKNGFVQSHDFSKEWFYPGVISNVNCRFENNRNVLFLSWNQPINSINEALIYSLYIRNKNNEFSKDINTKGNNVSVVIPFKVVPKFEIWISAQFEDGGNKSPDLYITCN